MAEESEIKQCEVVSPVAEPSNNEEVKVEKPKKKKK